MTVDCHCRIIIWLSSISFLRHLSRSRWQFAIILCVSGLHSLKWWSPLSTALLFCSPDAGWGGLLALRGELMVCSRQIDWWCFLLHFLQLLSHCSELCFFIKHVKHLYPVSGLPFESTCQLSLDTRQKNAFLSSKHMWALAMVVSNPVERNQLSEFSEAEVV